MGRETVRALAGRPDMRLVAAVGHLHHLGEDAGVLAGQGPCGVPVGGDATAALTRAAPDGVLVDFTVGGAVRDTVLAALACGVACVVGTTGIPADHVAQMRAEAEARGGSVLLVPNFALGAVLMMRFAREAARWFSWAEVLEMHHEGKRDAPSGTARQTARAMVEARGGPFQRPAHEEELVPGCRGADLEGVRVHSVRMPGLMAHQAVVLGGPGETLTLRHDTVSRECYMSGVLLAISRVRRLRGLALDLDALMD